MALPAGIEHFVAVAEARSFRGGAARLGLSPAAVSKAVARLEEELGVRLLERSTRSVALTAEGEVYLLHCRRALDALQAGQDLVREAAETVAGTLRVSLPPVLGPLVLGALPRLLNRHPRLDLDVALTDRHSRLVEEEVDVAVRIGALDDSALVARRLRTLRWVTVASPAYLAGAPPLRRPEDLQAHRCIKFVPPGGGVIEWAFRDRRSGEVLVVPSPSQVRLDLGRSMVEAAVFGLGVTQAFDFMVEEAIAAGRLVEVLADQAAPGPPVHALTRPGRQRVPRVRVFVELLAEALGAQGRS